MLFDALSFRLLSRVIVPIRMSKSLPRHLVDCLDPKLQSSEAILCSRSPVTSTNLEIPVKME